MEKVNMKKTIMILVLAIGLLNSSNVYGNDHMEDYQIILMHNELDVTNLYIDQVSKLKGTKLNDYLNIYETSIDIYDKNICKGFSYANLKGEPSFSKSADNLSILLTAKYTLTTRMNSTKVTLGPYIDTTTISV